MSDETWYEKLDYFENPFSIKPDESSKIFGYNDEIKSIVKKIKSGNIILVEGEYGLGKTTILKNLIKIFGGRRKLVLCSCNRYENDLDVDTLIVKSGSMLGRLMGKKKRGLILLLDEVHELSEDELSEIYEAYMDNYFKSIVCISPGEEVNFPDEMKEKIKKNVIKLPGISEDDAVRIVNERIGESKLIPEELIKEIYSISGNNPRRFLSNCEDVCREAIESGSDQVEKEHLAIL